MCFLWGPHANFITDFRRVRISPDLNFTAFLQACRHGNIKFVSLRVLLKELHTTCASSMAEHLGDKFHFPST